MNKSDSIKNLAVALAKFQGEVQNPKNTADNPKQIYPKYEPGKTFGQWTVLYKTSKNKVMCCCSCGTIKELYRTNLGSGKSISCGCSRRSGVEGTKLYNVWSSIKSRCCNENHRFYRDYGGRGITMCDEWKNDVTTFYTWAIEAGYQEGLTIDRIDNSKGYEPSNCRWVSQLIQANNKRNNLLITYEGITQSVSMWARAKNLNNRTILSRIRAGWSTENLFKPAEGRVYKNEQKRKYSKSSEGFSCISR